MHSEQKKLLFKFLNSHVNSKTFFLLSFVFVVAAADFFMLFFLLLFSFVTVTKKKYFFGHFSCAYIHTNTDVLLPLLFGVQIIFLAVFVAAASSFSFVCVAMYDCEDFSSFSSPPSVCFDCSSNYWTQADRQICSNKRYRARTAKSIISHRALLLLLLFFVEPRWWLVCVREHVDFFSYS